MKTIKGKYIRLTEDDLRRIVNEEIQRILEYKNPRKKLVDAAENNSAELIEHWCVVRFFVLTKIPTTNIKHWGGEIAKFIGNIGKVRLKGKMDDFEVRKKAIAEGFEKEGFLSNNSSCQRCLIRKLVAEGIDSSEYKEILNKVSEDCFKAIPVLIDIIARNDIFEIEKYIKWLEK